MTRLLFASIALIIGISSAAQADCWRFTEKSPEQFFGKPVGAAIERVCITQKTQNTYILKFYSSSDTVANLIVQQNSKSTWDILSLRLTSGSWALVAPLPTLKLPFFNGDKMTIMSNNQIESFATSQAD